MIKSTSHFIANICECLLKAVTQSTGLSYLQHFFLVEKEEFMSCHQSVIWEEREGRNRLERKFLNSHCIPSGSIISESQESHFPLFLDVRKYSGKINESNIHGSHLWFPGLLLNYIYSTSKSYWFYNQNIFWIWSFLTTYITSLLVQATFFFI